ncbi:hypothetical protein Dsin_015354 [Dipteronia sinensis]|uniref:DYW domain-containing protein n=1 Tax=Dipteronia sinensis TaxID=43782 RepID=A0AAE0ABU2_9ROSI|nr:hypothetical protein Dsin_015354 [Dipteronia sinensis]
MKAKHKLRQAIDSLYSYGRATTEEAYTRLVLECARASDVEQAKRLKSHMDLHCYEPTNTFLHNRLLHLYAKSGKLSDARNLFDEMPVRDIFSWNAMLSALAKSGSVEDLRAVFNQMPFRDSVSYNTVIAGFSGNGFSKEALQVFSRMREDELEPTDYSHVSALNACSQLLDLKRGKQIHGRIVVGNLGGNVFLSNALTDLYAKCGEVDKARWLFNRMNNKSVVSWNLMISGYLKNGQPLKCIELFREMQGFGLRPDQVTVSNVLGAYFQSGCIDEAGRLFRVIREKDKVCWTTMIVGYAQHGKEEDALMLFGEMLLEDVRPDSFTISSVVSSCAKLASLYHGQVVHGKAILLGVDDDLLVSSAIVDMYCKCGVTDDAWIVFTMMPTRNVVTWNAMINGYAQNGQDLQALAFYENIWEDVAFLRSLMKSKNVKKFAAYSWIEIDNKVHKFVAEDRSHPETEIIYKELSKLIKKLQEAGFIPNAKYVLHDVKEEEKFESICYHSEKLALAFGLIKKPQGGTPIRIMKNIRVCGDCHVFMKFVSKIMERPIILRDSNRFHHFVGGKCSCKDYW